MKEEKEVIDINIEDNTEVKIQNYFLGGMLLLAFLLVFLIFKPYIASLMLAMVLTVIFNPLQRRFIKITKSNGLAAALSTITVILIIMVPVTLLIDLSTKEVLMLAKDGRMSFLLDHIAILKNHNIDIKPYLQSFLGNTLNNIGGLLTNLVDVFAFIGITVITLFFFFKDGGQIRDSIFESLPISRMRSKRLTDDLGIGIRAVIGGYVLVAVLQGFISWIGFWIFGAASPAIWAMLTLVAALIPSFGASVMYALVIFSLLLQHHIGGAIGLFFWWIIAVSIIDNFVGPKFISGRSKINIILLLFSILGGIKLFGPAGFVIGPTIIIFFWSVLEMFQESGILPGTAPSIITDPTTDDESMDEEDADDDIS